MINIILGILVLNLASAILFKRDKSVIYCGIVGFSGAGRFNVDVINLLLYWNSIERGKHSTGIWSPDNGLLKETDEAAKFITKVDIKADRVLLGHVRHATVGNQWAKSGAHPHEFDNIVGVHNGTLKNHWAIGRYHELDTKSLDTDSQLMIKVIDKTNDPSVFSEIDGAASVMFADKRESDTIYAFRKDDQRPLFRGKRPEGMYISSIKETLQAISCINIQEFKIGNLYTIRNGNIITYTKIRPLEDSIKKADDLVKKSKKGKKNNNIIDSDEDIENKQEINENLRIEDNNIEKDKKGEKFVGAWVQAKVTMKMKKEPKKTVVQKGEWYFIKNLEGRVLNALNDEGEEITLLPDWIDPESCDIKKYDYVTSTVELNFKDKGIFCKEGDILLIDELKSNGSLGCINEDTGEGAVIELHNIRKSTKYEVDNYLKDIDDTIEENKEFSEHENLDENDPVYSSDLLGRNLVKLEKIKANAKGEDLETLNEIEEDLEALLTKKIEEQNES